MKLRNDPVSRKSDPGGSLRYRQRCWLRVRESASFICWTQPPSSASGLRVYQPTRSARPAAAITAPAPPEARGHVPAAGEVADLAAITTDVRIGMTTTALVQGSSSCRAVNQREQNCAMRRVRIAPSVRVKVLRSLPTSSS